MSNPQSKILTSQVKWRYKRKLPAEKEMARDMYNFSRSIYAWYKPLDEPTLRWYGSLFSKEFWPSASVNRPYSSDVTTFGHSITNGSSLCQLQEPDSKWNNLEYSRILFFIIYSLLDGLTFGRLISCIIYISFHLWLSFITYHFLSGRVSQTVIFGCEIRFKNKD